jgi:hypothetical protein
MLLYYVVVIPQEHAVKSWKKHLTLTPYPKGWPSHMHVVTD